MRFIIRPERLPEPAKVFMLITVVPLLHLDGYIIMVAVLSFVIRKVPSRLPLGIRPCGINHVPSGTPFHGSGRHGSTRLRVDYRAEARAVGQVPGHHLET
jgi:hypothetical protein